MNCAVCSTGTQNQSGCDLCDRYFCSEQCAQIDDYENTFPNCCPGVYWCIVCRTNYLNAAKGHLFIISQHEAHLDLKTYLDQDPNEWAFVDQCMNCGIWCYEFKSKTNVLSKYEGVSCGEKIRNGK
jgi:hypothetical protein